jgi:hAT family C-terminal dimerisation region
VLLELGTTRFSASRSVLKTQWTLFTESSILEIEKQLGVPDHAWDLGWLTAVKPQGFYKQYGEHMQELSQVAQLVLSIPPTAAGGERCFSAIGNIWSDKRATMLTGRVGLLVYIYYNYRVLNRALQPIQREEWDNMIKWLDSMPITEAEQAMLDGHEHEDLTLDDEHSDSAGESEGDANGDDDDANN